MVLTYNTSKNKGSLIIIDDGDMTGKMNILDGGSDYLIVEK